MMKKRMLSLAMAVALTAGMASCVDTPGSTNSDSTSSGEKSAEGNELALITDVGTIDDRSFNQGSWEGLEKFAKARNLTHKYYKPSEKSDEACLNAISMAVTGGAKVVVTPGFLFELPIWQAQTTYPDTKFVIIDAAPRPTSDADAEIKSNVLSIFYAEEQAGYLAGYAAVVEGYTKLGFMGGIAVPAVINFGYGFIQGADAAAKDMGLAPGTVSVKYTYVGNFDSSPENQAKAAAWFNEGTEVIFACGGPVGNSVMKAAEAADKAVIGVDVDQSNESESVIISAVKELRGSVYDALESVYDGSFKGGQSITLSAKEDGIGLSMESSKLKKFDQAQYDALFAKLKNESIKVNNYTVAKEATGVPTEIVEIDLIK